MHLLIWGKFPSSEEKEDVRVMMSEAAIPPEVVVNVISAFPFAAPQVILDSSSMYLTRVS